MVKKKMQNYCLRAESWMAKPFSNYLDEKKTSAGYKRQKMTLCNASRNLFRNVAFYTQNENTAYRS